MMTLTELTFWLVAIFCVLSLAFAAMALLADILARHFPDAD